MIAITGASGQLGRLVIDNLLTRTDASNIVALIRNPAKAAELEALGVTVRIADYDKPETLPAALSGVKKLLLISGSEVGQRFPQHSAVIKAASDAGLELFAYTSLLKAMESPMILAQEHQQTEDAIRASGLPTVILRNGWYTENLLGGLDHELASGKVSGASASGRWSTAARRDYAEAAAAVLTSTESQVGKVYELAGDQGFTLEEFAAALSKLSGKEVVYNNLDAQAYEQALLQAGLPAGFAGILVDAQVQAAAGWLADDSGSLSGLIGRPSTPLDESLAAVL